MCDIFLLIKFISDCLFISVKKNLRQEFILLNILFLLSKAFKHNSLNKLYVRHISVKTNF